MAAGCPALDPRAGGGLDFEGFATPVDPASLSFLHTAISTSLLLSESEAALFTGLDTSGWATSGVAGLLNSEAPGIQFDFDVPVEQIEVEVFLLPGNADLGVGITDVPVPGHGGGLVGLFFPSTLVPPPVGRHSHLRLGFDGVRFSSIQILASEGECNPDCTSSSRTSTLFIDDLRFRTVPEPAPTVLGVAALTMLAGYTALLAVRRRRAAARSGRTRTSSAPRPQPQILGRADSPG